MSHLDEGTLHAMLDGELEPNDVAEIRPTSPRAHRVGSGCARCGNFSMRPTA